MADKPGTADSIGPIQHLVKDCLSLFEEILNDYILSEENPQQATEDSPEDHNELLSQVAEYENAFNAWTTFASVFAASNQSLEYRIRKHKETHDIIIRLLELLRQNLFFFSCESTQDQPDLGQDSVVSIALAATKDVLRDLNTIVLTIRQSSRSSVLSLARNYAISNSGLEYLENLVLVALEALYPNAPEGLRQHLCNTMTDRYARLEHDAHRRGKTSNWSWPVIRQVDELKDLDKGKQPIENMESKYMTYQEPKTQHMEIMDQEAQANPLSSIDTTDLRRKLVPSATPRSIRSLSVYKADTGLHEPPLPQFQGTDTEVECEWCGDMLDGSILDDEGWSTSGRMHYRHDLKPWPCLSQECKQSRPSFSSRRELFNHMRSRHSPSWLESFYGQPMWVCDDHGEESPSADKRQPQQHSIYVFSSKWESERHKSTLHPSEVFSENPRLISSVNEVFSSSGAKLSDICPLCWLAPEAYVPGERPSVKSDIIASETTGPTQTPQAGGKGRVRFEDDSERQLDDIHDSAWLTPASFRMELHVADHLQYLMVLSMRLGKAMGSHDPEETSTSGSQFSNDAMCSSLARVEVTLDLLSEDESNQPYFSDAELSRLEQTKLQNEVMEDPLLVLESSEIPHHTEETSVSVSELSDHSLLSSLAPQYLGLDLLSEHGPGQPYLSAAELSQLRQVRLGNEAIESPFSVPGRSETPVSTSSINVEASHTPDLERQYYTYEGDGLVPVVDSEADLSFLLRKYKIKEGVDGSFWTDKLLRHILTRSRIKAQLSRQFESQQVDTFVNHIYPTTKNSSSGTYLKIFAILLLIQRTYDIGEFIDERLCDECLPIIIRNDRVFQMAEPKRQFRCFHDWREIEMEHFQAYQWMVNTPDLGPSKDLAPNQFHFRLSTRKPWRTSPGSVIKGSLEGNYRAAFRVEIHPTAHSYRSPLASQNIHCTEFEFKEVHRATADDSKDDQMRTEMPRFVPGHTHPHLVTALSIFTQGSRWGFIFPSPYCDLDYYLDTSSPPRGTDASCWISEQLSGLIGAVDTLHNPKHLALDPKHHFVRHGNINRNTILCYKRLGDQNCIVLTICNPGALDLRSENCNVMLSGYRPPECDIKGGTISRAYDIWTLGCLFLDLITWFLGGNEYLEEFETRRTTLFINRARTNTFFTFKTGKNEGAYVVQVKPEVTEWVLRLRQHQDCSPFLHDALDIVEQEMLVIPSPSMTRSSSERLRRHYERLSARCNSDSGYTQGKPWGDERLEIARKRMSESDIGFDCEILVPQLLAIGRTFEDMR